MRIYPTFLQSMFHFLDIRTFVKMSMTSRNMNKLISKLINGHYFNANAFNLTHDDIMFIPKFVQYMFVDFIKQPTARLNKLFKQLTGRDMVLYRFYKNPSEISSLSARSLKINHYSKYMKVAMETDPLLFRYGTYAFRCQDFWGRKALDADIRNFPYVSYRLRSNIEYAKRAVEYNGLFLENVHKLRNNKSICLIAIEENPQSFIYIGNSFQDKEFLKEIFYKNQTYWINRLKYLEYENPCHILCNDLDFMLKLASDFQFEISTFIEYIKKGPFRYFGNKYIEKRNKIKYMLSNIKFI